MQIKNDDGKGPVRGELGLLLLLVAFSMVGTLFWSGLFIDTQWIASAAWTAAVGQQAAASSAQAPAGQNAAPAAAQPSEATYAR